MPLRSSESAEEPSINLTPMIDVVMLLIIFFMVGTKFSDRERQFHIELPTVADAQPLTSRPDEIVVNVDRDGQFFLNEDPMTRQQLFDRLRQAQENYAEQAVVIRGDGEGTYQHIMDVLAMCHQVKITNIKLANKLKSESN